MRKIFQSFTSAITFSYLLFSNNPGLAETAPTNIIAPEEIAETISQAQPDSTNLVGQVTSVSQLADVQPTDWAFGALARKQKKFARKIKGSNSRNKYRKLVGKVHERVSNSRQDFLHKRA